MKKRVTLLAGVFLLLAGLGLGLAQTTVVLNSTYVPWDQPTKGWVRVWKPFGINNTQDDAIAGRSLVKFDIRHIPRTATITSATLHYYRQKSISCEPPEFMNIFHVTDDSWDPDVTIPPELYGWPTTIETPISTETGTEGWNAGDVASWLQWELSQASDFFSLKFQESTDGVINERIASPTAWYSNHRPYIEVTYSNASAIGPDLTVNRHDIAFSTMWPVPYDPVTITATVHNMGGTQTNDWFWVRFKDGINTIGDVQIVNPIPGGGGFATTQITWYPTEGVHDIKVVADPEDQPGGRIIEVREDNNSNADNHDPYPFEVRGQYKYYAESFENGVNQYDFGAYQRDADLVWYDGQPQVWDVFRTDQGPAYDGNWHVEIYIDASHDQGAAWLERHIPVMPDVSFIEASYFGILSGNGLSPCATLLPYDPDISSDHLDFTDQAQSGTYRRRRHCQLVNSLTQPEYFAAAGMACHWETQFTGLVDLFTIRVDPPRSTDSTTGDPPHLGLAAAYNNGAKFVWDGLSYQHLVYMSGDSILYSRSEDGVGDAWSNAEFLGSGQYPAIALDIDGYPRIVWVGWATGPALLYRKRTDTGWSPTHVLINYPPTGFGIGPPSLAIDPTYHGHVAYEHWGLTPPFSDIMYGYFDATQDYPPLYTQSVDNLTEGRCQFPAIALDYLTPQIVYSRPPSGTQPDDIFFAEKPGSTWQYFNVSQTSSIPDAHPHIANLNGSVQVVWSENGDEIKHRARDGVVWGTITPVSNTSGLSDYPRILVPGYYVSWMDRTERVSAEGGGTPPVWQTYYTSPATNPGDWNPAANIVPTVENASYPQATRRQDLIGNTYLDVVHTEGDHSLYTLEVSHKQVGWMNPPGGGEMLLTVNANEAAPGGGRALWKRLSFTVPRDLDVSFAIAGSADGQDGMKLVLDDHDFGWNTPEAWNGRELLGQRKVVRFHVPLKAGRHTLELHASDRPFFKGLRVWYGEIGGGPQSSEIASNIPASAFLAQSFPNPTFGKATIAYGLAKEGSVNLTVYNTLGQVVRELVSESQKPGFHRVEWDGKTQAGKQASSGIYFYRLNAGGFGKTNKLVVVR